MTTPLRQQYLRIKKQSTRSKRIWRPHQRGLQGRDRLPSQSHPSPTRMGGCVQTLNLSVNQEEMTISNSTSQLMLLDSLAAPQFQTLVNKCIHCGLCLASCPTYVVLGTEMDAPRGRIAMLRAVSAGRFPLSETISRYVYDCISCQSCRVACPSGVLTDAIFDGAKHIVAHSEFFPAPLADLEQRVRTAHNISGEPADNRLLWAEDLEVNPKDLVGKQTAEVVLFTGCVSALYPMVYGILQSLVNLLQAAHVGFTMLGSAEWCCGYPLLLAGLDITELKAHNLERIKRLSAKTLVTTCPSCYHTWKRNYAPDFLQVLHATEYLAQLIEAGRLPLRSLNTRVTYHDPCDLGRKSQVYDAPRQVLKAIPGVDFVEMKANRDNAWCCGGGGNLESVDVELSRAVAKVRLEQALDTGAEVIVSACQQCERTLAMTARRERAQIRVMDIAQLLGEAVANSET